MSEAPAIDRTTWRPKIASKARLRHDKVEDRHVLVFPEAALVLNPTAAMVLQLVDGERTAQAIIDELASRFEGADKDQIASEVMDLLSRLRARSLVEP
jgi:pyrroloquinoline quinone biosynthesis protein D